MIRVVARLAILAIAGCATLPVASDTVIREGYLANAPTLKLYETAEKRDAGSNQDCIQVVRAETEQSRPVPTGRVRVQGRGGQFDGDVVKLQVGRDIAHFEICDSHYILGADITPISGT
jgi:hypothetical protein